MSIDRYQSQVERVSKSATVVKAIVTDLENALATIEPVEIRVMRLEELVSNGLDMLSHDNVRLANAFFRRHVEIWVSYGNVDEIKWL
jgi:hypothetical protein